MRFGGVFQRIRYDNLKSTVKRTLQGHRRQETARFIAFRSHWKLDAVFCTPGEGNEKGGIEGEGPSCSNNCPNFRPILLRKVLNCLLPKFRNQIILYLQYHIRCERFCHSPMMVSFLMNLRVHVQETVSHFTIGWQSPFESRRHRLRLTMLSYMRGHMEPSSVINGFKPKRQMPLRRNAGSIAGYYCLRYRYRRRLVVREQERLERCPLVDRRGIV
jgi:hypothetical protein